MSAAPKPGMISDAPWSDREAACRFLERVRWPDGLPTCPHCHAKGRSHRIVAGSESKTRQGLWKCGQCREQFTVTVASSFERAHRPDKWLHAVYVLCRSKRGLGVSELREVLRVTHKTAGSIAARIRYAATQKPLSAKLGTRQRHARSRPGTAAGPLTLHPLRFRDAVAALLQIAPESRQDSLGAMDRQAALLDEI